MAYPRQATSPDFSGTQIPELWAIELLVKFYAATVFGSIANTDFKGNITSYGDVVKIRTTPDIQIADYVIGQDLQRQSPESSLVSINIDQGKYYSLELDRVQQRQSDYDVLFDWTSDAGQQMAIAIDRDILSTVYSDVDSNNAGTTAGVRSASYNLGSSSNALAMTKDNVVETLNDAESVLLEQNIPCEGLYAVLPTWAVNRLRKSFLRDVEKSGDDTSIARGGYIGKVSNFEVYQSNLLPTVHDGTRDVTQIIVGHKSALAFCNNITEARGPYQLQHRFADGVDGLQVYGFEVVKPDAMAHIQAYPA